MEERYHYRNLILWQRAQELAHEVMQVTKRLPNSWANAVIARQVIASATSIGANIAEGHGRLSVAAHRNHLSIARGSAAETDSWLDLLRREEIISPEEERQLHARCQQLLGILTTKMGKLQADRRGDSSIREDQAEYRVEQYYEPPFPFDPDDYSV